MLQEFMKGIKMFLAYIIPQHIAIQIGSHDTFLVKEDGVVENIESSVVEFLGKKEYLYAGCKHFCFGLHRPTYMKTWPISLGMCRDFGALAFFFKYVLARRFHYSPLHIYCSISPYFAEDNVKLFRKAIMSSWQVTKISFVLNPIAAAIGMGLDLRNQSVNILDIEFDTCTLSIITGYNIDFSSNIGGKTMKDNLVSEFNIKLGIPIRYSTIDLYDKIKNMHEGEGLAILNRYGMMHLTRDELITCYSPIIMSIIDGVKAIMKDKKISFTSDSPLYLVGGGSCFEGIADIFAENGIEVVIPDNSNEIVAIGLHKIAIDKCDYPICKERVILKKRKI